jgi:glyoxylase-like metal-dependent hydrolase (beta-lactamase superfamily II)
MRIPAYILVAALFLPGPVSAQTLDDFAKAMGADKVKTIAFSGKGYRYAVGQSHHPKDPWPKFNLKRAQYTINYETGAMERDITVTQWENPPRGGGRQPVRGEQRRRNGILGDVGWRHRSGRVGPSRSTSDILHALWTSPHGVIKAATAANAPVKTRKSRGKTYRTVSFAKTGAFRATAWFGKGNLLYAVGATVANSVFGDMRVVTLYSGYKSFGGVMFPTRIKMISGQHPSLDMTVTEVKPNAPADIEVPKKFKRGSGRVKVSKAADGVWYLTGGSHHSVAIEMADHVIVFEGPLNDARASALIQAVRKTIPGKPIRYVVNTHHHFDHSGGLRGFAAAGVTIVTHEINTPFYQTHFGKRTRIAPDMLAKSKRKAKFVTVADKHVMSDGKRRLELYRVRGNLHNDGMLIGYLPKEKFLMVADVYSGRNFRKSPAKNVSVFTANLWQNLQRLKLDIHTVLPIHGRKASFEQLKFAAGQK